MLSALLKQEKAASQRLSVQTEARRHSATHDDGVEYVIETVTLGETGLGNVRVDNYSCQDNTIVIVDSQNAPGSLVEMVQVLSELKLLINKARISSDGNFFVDEFHVTDMRKKKVYDVDMLETICQRLTARTSQDVSVSEIKLPVHEVVTVFEVTGSRNSIISEVTSFVASYNCNIHSLTVWSDEVVCALVVTVQRKHRPIPEEERQQMLVKLEDKLGDVEVNCFQKAINEVHAERRLHQLMQQCRVDVWPENSSMEHSPWRPVTPSSQASGPLSPSSVSTPTSARKGSVERKNSFRERSARPRHDRHVSMESLDDIDSNADAASLASLGTTPPQAEVLVDYDGDMQYLYIHIMCPDRHSLLFDVVCTVSEMGYHVCHATVDCEKKQACLDFYVRVVEHRNRTSLRVPSEAELHDLEDLLLSAIQRMKGMRLDVPCKDSPGTLSSITRILAQHKLTISACTTRIEQPGDNAAERNGGEGGGAGTGGSGQPSASGGGAVGTGDKAGAARPPPGGKEEGVCIDTFYVVGENGEMPDRGLMEDVCRMVGGKLVDPPHRMRSDSVASDTSNSASLSSDGTSPGASHSLSTTAPALASSLGRVEEGRPISLDVYTTGSYTLEDSWGHFRSRATSHGRASVARPRALTMLHLSATKAQSAEQLKAMMAGNARPRGRNVSGEAGEADQQARHNAIKSVMSSKLDMGYAFRPRAFSSALRPKAQSEAGVATPTVASARARAGAMKEKENGFSPVGEASPQDAALWKEMEHSLQNVFNHHNSAAILTDARALEESAAAEISAITQQAPRPDVPPPVPDWLQASRNHELVQGK